MIVTTIYFELQLKISWLAVTALEVTQGSATCIYRMAEYRFDCVNQEFNAGPRDAACLPFGMNTRYIK